MIAYLDSSVLARAYLPDEAGHDEARRLLGDPEVAAVTGTWTRIEASGALTRAARVGRGDAAGALALLDADLASAVTVLRADQDHVERHALELVVRHGLRAMEAWHVAVAAIVVPPLLAPGEEMGFASRDDAQRRVAQEFGFTAL